MRIEKLFSVIFLTAMLSFGVIGCSSSDAQENEALVEELQEQMESAEQQVADAVEHIRDSHGDATDEIRERIAKAKRQLSRAQQKLEELYQARIESEDAYEEYGSDEDGDEYEGHEYNDDFDFDIEIDHESIERAIKGLGATLERLGEALENDNDVRAVDRDELKRLFPDEVAGMERTNMNSSSEGAFGFRVTQAEATYRGQRTDLTLTLVDLGSLGGVAREGLDMFGAEIDRESDDEVTRTTEIDGYPAKFHFRKGRREDKIGVVVMVEDQFVFALEAEGTDLTEDLVDDVLSDFPLDKIADLLR